MTEKSLVRHVERNTRGRDYVVGDIHGHLDRLERLLSWLGFDRQRDRLFAVGDFIDRGPDSAAALRLTREPWMHAVRGNHEQMMLDALDEAGRRQSGSAFALWQTNGGQWARQLAAGTAATLRRLAAALPIALTVDCADGSLAGLVHAGVPDTDWSRLASLASLATRPNTSIVDAALWSRESAYQVMQSRDHETPFAADLSVGGIDRVYHGHTPMPYPIAAANTRWLDTGVFIDDGGLSLAAIDDDDVWTLRHGASRPDTGWVDVRG